MQYPKLLLVLLALVFVTGIAAAALEAGVEAPDFTLTTTDDEPITLSEFRGQVVILHFWKSN